MSETITIAASPGVVVNQALPATGRISVVDLANGTPFDLTYLGFGCPGSMIIEAGTKVRLHAEVLNTGQMNILPVNNVGVSGTGIINITIYFVTDTIPPGTFPIAIPTQVVSAKVSTVTSLVNDGNSAGTQIVESTVGGAPGSTLSLTNDGNNSFIAVLIANVVNKLIQISNAGNLLKLGGAGQTVEQLGNELVDGNLTVSGNGAVTGTFTATGDATFNGAAPSITAANRIDAPIVNAPGGVLQFQEAGTNVMQITSTGPGLNANMRFGFLVGSISRFTGFSGTGSGTFSTNLGTTPNQIAFNPCTLSGSSQTIGGTIAQSSVVTTGNALAWGGMAFKDIG